jgi:hypothetical protein
MQFLERDIDPRPKTYPGQEVLGKERIFTNRKQQDSLITKKAS